MMRVWGLTGRMVYGLLLAYVVPAMPLPGAMPRSRFQCVESTMSDDVIPLSYEHWRNCIEVRCKIRLTPTYIRERLDELQDDKHTKTREFARLYGGDHLQRTIAWFRRAADEMTEDRK